MPGSLVPPGRPDFPPRADPSPSPEGERREYTRALLLSSPVPDPARQRERRERAG
ncbi:hypothetical protein [Amycolatopsis sp. H20-H5]|uniref:hypothetical protein n=1 Tax=Amycolatopsis sp. H20-H5 TaxID=3046309 RepID=UPI002DB7D00A|nr:hypothetical protein [Amycolatopsis sp. H20-H5]MEC3979508.1 hypothetical protein [Amycolatopsis sp. H20-H5]